MKTVLLLVLSMAAAAREATAQEDAHYSGNPTITPLIRECKLLGHQQCETIMLREHRPAGTRCYAGRSARLRLSAHYVSGCRD
jgi:hypothetical protein